jgi:hypothetical protein
VGQAIEWENFERCGRAGTLLGICGKCPAFSVKVLSKLIFFPWESFMLLQMCNFGKACAKFNV